MAFANIKNNPNSGRGTPAGWSSAEAYGKAYGQQRKLAGRTPHFGVSRAEYLTSKKKKGGGFQFPGGFGGGGGRGSDFGKLDFEYQKELDKLVWERSTPNVTGVGATVRWDRDKNMVTSALDEENQAIYDAMYERQKRFGAEADAFSGTGWQDAQQQRFDQKRALYAESDAREEAIRRERQYATGSSTTGMFEEDARVAGNLNQRNMQLEEAAFNESQQLIDSSLSRQSNDINRMMTQGEIANRMIKMPQPFPQANMLGVSEASTAWRDLQALEAAKKSKGQSDAWGSILGGGGNNLSYIATATTQAIGEDGLRVFEDWRDYMFYTLPTFATSFGRYRATAPKIVEEIDKKDNSKTLYKEIWDDYLKPIFNLIKKDKDDPKALSDYKVMVKELKNKYIV